MDFTKENVEENWYNLNNNQSTDEKKRSDIFLTEFKKSQNVIPICLQLYQTENESNQIFSTLILYQHLKENISSIIDNKDKFDSIKNLLFVEIIPKLQNKSNIIKERVCFSISILILGGIISFWPNCLDELFQFAKSSNFNCILSVIILANLSKELNDIVIPTKIQYRIKDCLINNNDLVKNFIEIILDANKTNDSPNNGNNIILYNYTLDLAKSWLTFEFNVLSFPPMTKLLISQIKLENLKNICELFSDCLKYAKSAKPEMNENEITGDNIQDYYINNIMNKEEYESINFLIENIIQNILDYKNNTDPNKKLSSDKIEALNCLAKIFSSVSENFIYLFFMKNKLSQQLLELFLYFISSQERCISIKFFESINSFREYINIEYKFINYSDAEKVEFSNYLLKIVEAVMTNCKLKYLKPENEILLEGGNQEENPAFKLNNNIDGNDTDVEDEEETNINDIYHISITDYRTQAEDVFFNIFIIFAENFKEDGVNYFLSTITSIITKKIDINSDAIINDEPNLKIVEILIYVIKCISEGFTALNLNPKPLIDFSIFIVRSKVLLNEAVLVNYLIYLDQVSLFLYKDISAYLEIIKFLLGVCVNIKKISTMASSILLSITQSSKEYCEEVFNFIYKIYVEQYDSLEGKIIPQLADCLCNAVSIVNEENNTLIGTTLEHLYELYIKVLQPPTERMKLVSQMIQQNGGIEGLTKEKIGQIKNEINKNASVLENILKNACFVSNGASVFKKSDAGPSNPFFDNIFEFHFNNLINELTIIFSCFNKKDEELIEKITNIYTKCIQKLKNQSMYPQIEKLMLTSFNENPENTSSILILKAIYSNILRNNNNNKSIENEIISKFFIILEKLGKSIITSAKNQIDKMTIFSQFFSQIYELFKSVDFSNESTNKIILNAVDLLVEGYNYMIDNTLYNNLFKAFAVFIQKTPIELAKLKVSNIVTAVFSDLEKLSAYTIFHFTSFIIECLKIDKDSFLMLLKQLFLTQKKLKIFSEENVNIIIEYLRDNSEKQKCVKCILNDIVNITKGMGDIGNMAHYEMEVARSRIRK